MAPLASGYLQLDDIVLKRLQPAMPADLPADRYYSWITSERPLCEKVSDKTVILRIPSFEGSEKKYIDSVVYANQARIASAENLVIDIRDNGGGSDRSFHALLPFLYTNPIRSIGVEMLSTPLNNQRMAGFVKDPEMPEDTRVWAGQMLQKLEQGPGKFVAMDSTAVSVVILDSVYQFPKRVGILINGGNGSTAEEFLLMARQSKKVKLFGTTTAGVLDISNLNLIDSPCGELKLAYGLSRSRRIPDFTIDDKGIPPDYFIDRSVPAYEWINFVVKILTE